MPSNFSQQLGEIGMFNAVEQHASHSARNINTRINESFSLIGSKTLRIAILPSSDQMLSCNGVWGPANRNTSIASSEIDALFE